MSQLESSSIVEVPVGLLSAHFFRFTWCDTNGIARAKVVPRHSLSKVINSGIGLCSLTCVFDAQSQPAKYPKYEDQGCPDGLAMPQKGTWRLCPWSGTQSGHTVAQCLVQIHEKDQNLSPYGFDTRYVCTKLVGQLRSEFGFELYSAFEYEFVLTKDGEPVHKGTDLFATVVLKPMEPFLYRVADKLHEAGINVEAINPEYGMSQYELAIEPKVGVSAADDGFLLKQCVKEMAVEMGYQASFMCNPFGDTQTGGHFNFSLWDIGRHNNLFGSDPNNLSIIANNWIAGMMKHAAAITAFLSPTNNCFARYFEGGFAPFYICYGNEHRGCMIRVKQSHNGGVYFEFRSAGGAANPYLVIAAVVAAGLDGLRNKLEPQPMGFNNKKQLPRNLGDALNALEKDDVMCKAMGEDLINCYLALKRQKDLPKKDQAEQINAYFKLL